MKWLKMLAVVLVLFAVSGCETPDLDRPSLKRYVVYKVYGDSNNVTINGEENIDLTVDHYEQRVKVIAERVGEDPFFERWVFPLVTLTVTDYSGSYTVVNAEIWDETTGQIGSDGIIVDPFESITIYYRLELRP